MSRIPTFESKLRPKKQQTDEIRQLRRSKSTECIPPTLKSIRDQALDKVPGLPVIKKPAKINLRRSKSISDMRAPVKILNSITANITSRYAPAVKNVRNRAVDKVPELPVIKKPIRLNLRRSKSSSDIRAPNKNSNLIASKFVPNGKNGLNGTHTMTKNGNTISRSNITRPNIKPNIVKAGTKRAGDACESDLKNKILKKTKVPDWDYKTRFLMLQEKYNILQVEYNTIENCAKDAKSIFETEISALQKSEQAWKEQAMKLSTINEELTKYKVDLEDKYQQISTQLDSLKKDSSVVQSKYEQYYQETQNLLIEKEQLLNEVFNGEKLRRKLHNTIQDLKGNIRVFCRLRPALNMNEVINVCNFNFPNDNSIEISKIRESIATTGTIKSNEPQEFTFDKVFNQDATQASIFEELSQLIQSAMDGYHVCVFAYGQTGSGKTYTMQGESDPKECLGMIPRSAQLIFERIQEMQKMGWSYKVQASFLEIYNETVRDLLNMKSGNLDIRFNEGKGTTVSNLTVISISSAEELMQYMSKAQQNRSTAVTNYNEHSSRSHAVTKIYIEARYQDSDDVYVGSVSLVDLAGSESAKLVSNARLAETKNINKSLSSLGNVMMALYKKESHIPYRNSKLTFLLQSSLGGNCKCLMVVNISPLNDSYNESINALRFAAKVKEVKIASSKNKLLSTPSH